MQLAPVRVRKKSAWRFPFAIVSIATNPVNMFLGPPLRSKAMILSRGINVGVQASGGVTGQIGYIWPS